MKKSEPIEPLNDVHWQKIIKKSAVDGAVSVSAGSFYTMRLIHYK